MRRQFNWRHDELVDVRGSETVTRWPSWCRNEQFRQVFLSSTMKTVIHCYGYPELNTVYHIEPLQIVSHCMMYSPLSYLRVFVTTRAAAFNTRCSLSVTVFGDPNNRLQQLVDAAGNKRMYEQLTHHLTTGGHFVSVAADRNSWHRLWIC